MLSGGQQRFEEEVAVILASRTIAGTVILPHQVEIQRCPAAGIIAVIHAQQADPAEGDGAHRHEGGESDGPGHETLRQPAIIQP